MGDCEIRRDHLPEPVNPNLRDTCGEIDVVDFKNPGTPQHELSANADNGPTGRRPPYRFNIDHG
ncbi:MAG: hypothetical protein DWQ29_09555 [Planctomycetota bacterium]|nr:MAG: hypothetical protein DWQ29_09555 [Planctomycetota bacterium]